MVDFVSESAADTYRAGIHRMRIFSASRIDKFKKPLDVHYSLWSIIILLYIFAGTGNHAALSSAGIDFHFRSGGGIFC